MINDKALFGPSCHADCPFKAFLPIAYIGLGYMGVGLGTEGPQDV